MSEERKVDYLRPIPDWADLVFSSGRDGERNDEGLRTNELYAMSSRDGRIERITHGRHYYNHFAASADGGRIVCNRYVGDTNGDGRLDFRDRKMLWVLDLERGAEWPVVPDHDAGWGGIDWSPDGEWIYASMLRYGDQVPLDIHRVRPDGTDLQNITRDIQTELGPPQATRKAATDCGVSHDGEWIVFLYHPRWPGEGPPKSKVAVSRVDRTACHMVTDGGPLPGGMRGPWSHGDFDPEFSPDGRSVCFSRVTDVAFNFGVSSAEIWTCDVDGTNLRRVTGAGHHACHGIPDWSAGGRIVTMVLDEQAPYVGPLVVNADGTAPRRYPNVHPGTHFRWIPGR